MSLLEEARKCRRDAKAFAGKPEAPFLLKIARTFEDLHLARRVPSAPGRTSDSRG